MPSLAFEASSFNHSDTSPFVAGRPAQPRAKTCLYATGRPQINPKGRTKFQLAGAKYS